MEYGACQWAIKTKQDTLENTECLVDFCIFSFVIRALRKVKDLTVTGVYVCNLHYFAT